MNDSVQQLRDRHRKDRRKLSAATLSEHAEQLEKQLASVPEYQQASQVAAYIAILGEISLEPVIRAGSTMGKCFYLPILRDELMAFAPWQPDSPLLKKRYGLLEPDCSEADWIEPSALDLVLTPLVVFDAQGNRIGQGGGYYDRTFEFIRASGKPLLIGVAHDSQRESALEPQPWDIPLHKVVTERAIYDPAWNSSK